MSVILTAVPPFNYGPCAGETSLLVAYQAFCKSVWALYFIFILRKAKPSYGFINLRVHPAHRGFFVGIALISDKLFRNLDCIKSNRFQLIHTA